MPSTSTVSNQTSSPCPTPSFVIAQAAGAPHRQVGERRVVEARPPDGLAQLLVGTRPILSSSLSTKGRAARRSSPVRLALPDASAGARTPREPRPPRPTSCRASATAAPPARATAGARRGCPRSAWRRAGARPSDRRRSRRPARAASPRSSAAGARRCGRRNRCRARRRPGSEPPPTVRRRRRDARRPCTRASDMIPVPAPMSSTIEAGVTTCRKRRRVRVETRAVADHAAEIAQAEHRQSVSRKSARIASQTRGALPRSSGARTSRIGDLAGEPAEHLELAGALAGVEEIVRVRVGEEVRHRLRAAELRDLAARRRARAARRARRARRAAWPAAANRYPGSVRSR